MRQQVDIVARLRGKKAQKVAPNLCTEAADVIELLRQRYHCVRRANSIALRELEAARLKDDKLRRPPILAMRSDSVDLQDAAE
jgi:hypothetical protein